MKAPVAALLVMAACGGTPAADPDAATPGGCEPASALARCRDGDPWGCAWGRLWAARGGDVLDELVVSDGAGDSTLRALFPAIGTKAIVDAEVPMPSGATFEMPGFDPYAIPTSIDWRADPAASNTWRQYFQALELSYFHTPGDADELGVALLVAWREQALYEAMPPDYTWGNHAVSIRLANVSRLLDHYIATRDELARSVLQAAAEVIVGHLYNLATESCYTPLHNHGMMQDIALLEYARVYPAMRDSQALWELGQTRALIQAQGGVSSDGLHIENTSSYHHFFLTLLNRLIQAHQVAGAAVPASLIALRDSMFEPLVQQLQPDLTWAQFGDSADLDAPPYLDNLLEASAALGVGDPAARSTLDWIASGGTRGVAPSTDAVYEHSGYAAFRDHWGADAASLHFKTGHLGRGHYRPDETAFELFAYGTTLITQPGLFSYVADDPFVMYQLSPAAQNVLVVDGDTTYAGEPNPRSQLVAHGQDATGVWIQGTHDNFGHLGITRLVRTVFFAKPDVLVIVDHVRAAAEHAYAQHFHVHPHLDQLVMVDDRTVVVSGTNRPSLTVAAGFASQLRADRGIAEGTDRRGWYFPIFRQSEPAYDVVFEQRGADVDRAVVLAVAAPGQPATTVTNIAVASDGTTFTVSWLQNGAARQVAFPVP